MLNQDQNQNREERIKKLKSIFQNRPSNVDFKNAVFLHILSTHFTIVRLLLEQWAKLSIKSFCYICSWWIIFLYHLIKQYAFTYYYSRCKELSELFMPLKATIITIVIENVLSLSSTQSLQQLLMFSMLVLVHFTIIIMVWFCR